MGRSKRIIKWLKASFEYGTRDASARKLTAFAIVLCVVSIHFAWTYNAIKTSNFDLMVEILLSDFAFVSALLGMTTYQYIKDKSTSINKDA